MRSGSMDTDIREARLDAQTLAEVLNAMRIQPQIMGMPTFVALTNGHWQVVWLPQTGWKPVRSSDATDR